LKEVALMRRTIPLLATMALTLLMASGLALVAGIGSAAADSSVVGPGESIQKAINAADPGDTIVVKGLHREDVVIFKNGIKLRGEDGAVFEAPTRAKADTPCSKFFGGPQAICILGDFNPETGEINKRVRDVSVSGFTIRGFKHKEAFLIDVFAARNTTVVGNRITGNLANGISFGGSVNTTIAKNHVIGGPETPEKGILVGISSRTKIVNNVVRSYDHGIEAEESTNTTIAGNDLIGNPLGVVAPESTGTKIVSNDITDSTIGGTLILDSTGTKILSNDVSRFGNTGITIFGPERAKNDAKVVGNRISGGPWGIWVGGGAHRGSLAANTIRHNCAGMFFEAFPGQPVGGFEVKGNTVENNTRKCPTGIEEGREAFSGIGIALLGASGMEVTANHLSGNIPSGPTPVSGGVVVSTNPFGEGSAKPKNNSIIGNHFGPNKPDIFWDKSGSGNSFVGNLCNKSVPSSLCN
jgi:parallel beta-helix repeat protein